MIAEIYGKVSSTNSNLTERSEDELTGNFFGNLRYLPFDKGMRHILKSSVYPSLSAFDNFDAEAWPNDDCVFFWKREAEAEPDVLLVFDNTVIIIEVKYLSGLSSDDTIDNSEASDIRKQDEKSCNQLVREGELLERIARGREKILLLLAPEAVAHKIYSDVVERKILSSVQFGYITWQKAFDALQEIAENTSGRFERTVVDDLIKLLYKKGFEGFRTFNIIPSFVVNVAETWKFDYSAASIGFSFLVGKNVKKDEYYEFG